MQGYLWNMKAASWCSTKTSDLLYVSCWVSVRVANLGAVAVKHHKEQLNLCQREEMSSVRQEGKKKQAVLAG